MQTEGKIQTANFLTELIVLPFPSLRDNCKQSVIQANQSDIQLTTEQTFKAINLNNHDCLRSALDNGIITIKKSAIL